MQSLVLRYMKHARRAIAFVWWLIFVLKFVLNTSLVTSFGRKCTEKTVLDYTVILKCFILWCCYFNISKIKQYKVKLTASNELFNWVFLKTKNWFVFTQLLFIPRNTTIIIPRRDQKNVLHEHVYSGRSSEGGWG